LFASCPLPFSSLCLALSLYVFNSNSICRVQKTGTVKRQPSPVCDLSFFFNCVLCCVETSRPPSLLFSSLSTYRGYVFFRFSSSFNRLSVAPLLTKRTSLSSLPLFAITPPNHCETGKATSVILLDSLLLLSFK
jgi:hypothetical protein